MERKHSLGSVDFARRVSLTMIPPSTIASQLWPVGLACFALPLFVKGLS